MIDSRDLIAAKKQADNEVLIPVEPKIPVSGGIDFNDQRLIWDRLEQGTRQVSRHGAAVWRSPKGA